MSRTLVSPHSTSLPGHSSRQLKSVVARRRFSFAGFQTWEIEMTTIARHCRPMAVGVFLAVASTAALADDRCQQLEALHQQYAGVTLTSSQQALKRKLVAWYYRHCRTRAQRAAAG
jgi:hypothetical protein